MKTFKTEASAKAAINKQGIKGIPHTIKWFDGSGGGYYIEFTVELDEDVIELTDRGFVAKKMK